MIFCMINLNDLSSHTYDFKQENNEDMEGIKKHWRSLSLLGQEGMVTPNQKEQGFPEKL